MKYRTKGAPTAIATDYVAETKAENSPRTKDNGFSNLVRLTLLTVTGFFMFMFYMYMAHRPLPQHVLQHQQLQRRATKDLSVEDLLRGMTLEQKVPAQHCAQPQPCAAKLHQSPISSATSSATSFTLSRRPG
jgi:hypothetical protein